jgi:hypothetical protein
MLAALGNMGMETDQQNTESDISTDAGRIDDMAARRRLQPPPDGLEHRIASALNGSGLASVQLGELIAEVRTAVTAANAAAETAKARYLDPAIIDPDARRVMEDADHLSRRLRLALPRLETCHIRRVNSETYNAWAQQFDVVKQKHAQASRILREVYTNLEHQLVSALRTARQVDAEVYKILDAKPADLPQANGDGRRLLSVECAARHLDGVDAVHSLMNVKIPTFAEPNKFSWPPPSIPIGVQVAASLLGPRGPSPDWQRDLAQRDAERRRDAQRMAEYHNRMAREREDKENAAARAARQRNGSAP